MLQSMNLLKFRESGSPFVLEHAGWVFVVVVSFVFVFVFVFLEGWSFSSPPDLSFYPDGSCHPYPSLYLVEISDSKLLYQAALQCSFPEGTHLFQALSRADLSSRHSGHSAQGP